MTVLKLLSSIPANYPILKMEKLKKRNSLHTAIFSRKRLSIKSIGFFCDSSEKKERQKTHSVFLWRKFFNLEKSEIIFSLSLKYAVDRQWKYIPIRNTNQLIENYLFFLSM
ncbi:MAG: hypothetical protein KBF99_19830 [Leptospiraceae bacterium]|nr:hypothetical protein [Leptospiraceae bacterium]MBK7058047.1 hypothetical protein [Leptospiraceae bacterium]MBP9165443.1 hypothetical protein [Leptospiraceae bacterium]